MLGDLANGRNGGKYSLQKIWTWVSPKVICLAEAKWEASNGARISEMGVRCSAFDERGASVIFECTETKNIQGWKNCGSNGVEICRLNILQMSKRDFRQA